MPGSKSADPRNRRRQIARRFPRALGRGVHVAVAGIGGARSVAISRRMSANRRRGMAASAIWNAMYRPWLLQLCKELGRHSQILPNQAKCLLALQQCRSALSLGADVYDLAVVLRPAHGSSLPVSSRTMPSSSSATSASSANFRSSTSSVSSPCLAVCRSQVERDGLPSQPPKRDLALEQRAVHVGPRAASRASACVPRPQAPAPSAAPDPSRPPGGPQNARSRPARIVRRRAAPTASLAVDARGSVPRSQLFAPQHAGRRTDRRYRTRCSVRDATAFS
jgi:hypothetical protein